MSPLANLEMLPDRDHMLSHVCAVLALNHGHICPSQRDTEDTPSIHPAAAAEGIEGAEAGRREYAAISLGSGTTHQGCIPSWFLALHPSRDKHRSSKSGQMQVQTTSAPVRAHVYIYVYVYIYT